MAGIIHATETIYGKWTQWQGYAVETDHDGDLHCFKCYDNDNKLLATSYPMDKEQMDYDREALDDGDNLMDWDNLKYEIDYYAVIDWMGHEIATFKNCEDAEAECYRLQDDENCDCEFIEVLTNGKTQYPEI